MLETDFLIVGAGMAGASIAYRLAPHHSVALIEMEHIAGYHTTGRSAAFYAETYGGEKVQPLTSASKEFFHRPPKGFSQVPLIEKLGAVHVYDKESEAEALELYEQLKQALPAVEKLLPEDVQKRFPYLKPERIAGGIDDPDCGSLDVAALHQGFLNGSKSFGAVFRLEYKLKRARFEDDFWVAETSEGLVKAKVLVNAAGAWADIVAENCGVQPIGLQPLRRTVVTVDNPNNAPFLKDSSILMVVGEEYYFKPEGGGYLITPGDEILSPASDVQPEEMDVAIAIHQFEEETGTKIKNVASKWAGLRCFAPDRVPVIGFDEEVPNFFWSAGLGGFGIQTAPAWSDLAAILLVGETLPKYLEECGVEPDHYNPARFRG